MTNARNYLALPTNWSDSKISMYGMLQESLESMIVGWKNKLLSIEGKKVLLKAVAQDLLNYVLCYVNFKNFKKWLFKVNFNYAQVLVVW